jgi:hypothetical protein
MNRGVEVTNNQEANYKQLLVFKIILIQIYKEIKGQHWQEGLRISPAKHRRYMAQESIRKEYSHVK